MEIDIEYGLIKEKLYKALQDRPEYLFRLPKTEQYLYELHVIKGLNQRDIAEMVGVTQGAISSRLRKIHKRILFLRELEKYDLSTLEEDLEDDFEEFEIVLLKTMMDTTCQSETARRLNELYSFKGDDKMTQVKVRHRLGKCLDKMKKKESKYYDLFLFINKNLYVLHEVRLPHFQK